MAQKLDMANCNTVSNADNALSAFSALSYHFGMLLGVEDFSTEQAYHRGKMRLHNAWLHGMGVVWGFDVIADFPSGEVRVSPGLALDAAGRLLHLDAQACINVGEWFNKHQADITATGDDNTKVFDAHVAIRFKACLTRQVPALLDPCEGSGGGTAYSRMFETVDLRLVPGNPPPVPAVRNHRVRVLFGLEPANLPADQPIVDERERIATLAETERPAAYIVALRRFAAMDTIDQIPADSSDGKQTIFPLPEDTPIILASITGIKLVRQQESWTLTEATIDITVRPTLLATSVIQELICGPLGGALTAIRSSGPRVRPETVVISDDRVEFETDKDLEPNSLKPRAFTISIWDGVDGWNVVGIFKPTLSGTPPRKVTIPLRKPLTAHERVKLIVRGTGNWPIVGTDFVPLAGCVGGPQPAVGDGGDFVLMMQRG